MAATKARGRIAQIGRLEIEWPTRETTRAEGNKLASLAQPSAAACGDGNDPATAPLRDGVDVGEGTVERVT